MIWSHALSHDSHHCTRPGIQACTEFASDLDILILSMISYQLVMIKLKSGRNLVGKMKFPLPRPSRHDRVDQVYLFLQSMLEVAHFYQSGWRGYHDPSLRPGKAGPYLGTRKGEGLEA